MRRRICLVTTGQPATNPRLVREADALSAAGYEVDVVGAFAGPWAVETEPAFMRGRSWSLDIVDWRREQSPWLFWRSRLRHHLAVRWASERLPITVCEDAVTRPSRELRVHAARHRSDLYIAHNLGALPAAARAASRYGARLGFDAEDFHRGQLAGTVSEPIRVATSRVERHYLPLCDYVTAASPGIADAYRPLTRRGDRPVVVLNVSSLSERGDETPPAGTAGPLRLYWFSQTIGPHRGLEDVIRAMGMVVEPVELHLRGTWADGYEATVRELVTQCGVGSDRVVAYGPASPAEMVRLASRFDIGLALEPGGTANSAICVSNKFYTYLMAGLAVIASRTPGQQWAIEQVPAAGWTYHPGSAIELAALLRACAVDRSRVQTARLAARAAADTQFCWEVQQRSFLDTIGGVLDADPIAMRQRAASDPMAAPAGPIK
jgi:glycosyltransferase involved in cell wall biosynthesis